MYLGLDLGTSSVKAALFARDFAADYTLVALAVSAYLALGEAAHAQGL